MSRGLRPRVAPRSASGRAEALKGVIHPKRRRFVSAVLCKRSATEGIDLLIWSRKIPITMGFAESSDLKKILTAHKINVLQLGGNNDSEPNMIYSESSLSLF